MLVAPFAKLRLLFPLTFLSFILVLWAGVTPTRAGIAELRLDWKYLPVGSHIGTSVDVLDLDGDKKTEMVLGYMGRDDYWYILQRRPSGDYVLGHVGGPYFDIGPNGSSAIDQIRVKDVDKDGIAEIFVATSGGKVHVVDGATFSEKASFAVNIREYGVAEMELGDVDRDGVDEIVILSDYGLEIFDSVTYLQEFTYPLSAGKKLLLGNVDDDAALEIVITSGGTGIVLDGVTREWQQSFGSNLGLIIRLGDIDGDGRDEIVSTTGTGYLRAFDVDLNSQKWQVSILSTETIALFDVTGDGKVEIITDNGGQSGVNCFDGTSGSLLWRTFGTSRRPYSVIHIADSDDDGELELITGVGANCGHPGFISIKDLSTMALEWESIPSEPPLTAVDAGDVDNDGEKEIVLASFMGESQWESGGASMVFDGVTHDLEWVFPLDGVRNTGVRDVKVADVNGDGYNEIVYANGSAYDGYISVYDGYSRKLLFKTPSYWGYYFTSIDVADVDLDGKPEIVVGQGTDTIPSNGNRVIVFDGVTGAEKWASEYPGQEGPDIYFVKIANIDADANPEIIATTNKGYSIYDGVNHAIERSYSGTGLMILEAFDIDKDGQIEIIARTDKDQVKIFDGRTFALESVITMDETDVYIEAIRAADADNDGEIELLIAFSDYYNEYSSLAVYRLNGIQEARLPNFPLYRFGSYNDMLVVDLGGDGVTEILMGGPDLLYQFSLHRLDALVQDAQALSFMPQELNSASPALTAKIMSFGANAELDVSITGTDSTSFSQTNNCSSLADNEFCTVEVAFSPISLGLNQATLVITSSNPKVSPVSIALSGDGVPIKAMTAEHGWLMMGTVLMGTGPVQKTIEISSAVSLNGLTATIENDMTGSFTLGGDCSEIQANSSCTLSVTFNPDFGDATASLILTPSDPKIESLFVGINGHSFIPSRIPTSINACIFDTLKSGDTSSVEEIVIINTSGLPGLEVSLSGPDSDQFRISDTCSQVEPNEGCVVSVQFSPNRVGISVAEVSVTSDNVFQEASVIGINGTCAEGAIVAMSDSVAVTPEKTPIGKTSPPFPVNLTNNSVSSSLIIAISGADDEAFTVTDNCQDIEISSDCSAYVTFTPAREGVHEALLKVSSDDPLSIPLEIPIAGTGVAPAEGGRGGGGGGGCFINALGF